jgi:hypothetical protein
MSAADKPLIQFEFGPGEREAIILANDVAALLRQIDGVEVSATCYRKLVKMFQARAEK